MICLFLDDERTPRTNRPWIIARSFHEATNLCLFRCPDHISFDHDLGEHSPSGMQFARYLVERDMATPGYIPENFTYDVHSANPVGRDNIIGLLNNYLENR